MKPGHRAVGAFLSGLLLVFVIVTVGTSLLITPLHPSDEEAKALGEVLVLPELALGGLCGWWLAKRSLAKSAAAQQLAQGTQPSSTPHQDSHLPYS
jgi:hypothetical protein